MRAQALQSELKRQLQVLSLRMLSVCLSVCLSVSVCFPFFLCLSVCQSVCLSVWMRGPSCNFRTVRVLLPFGCISFLFVSFVLFFRLSFTFMGFVSFLLACCRSSLLLLLFLFFLTSFVHSRSIFVLLFRFLSSLQPYFPTFLLPGPPSCVLFHACSSVDSDCFCVVTGQGRRSCSHARRCGRRSKTGSQTSRIARRFRRRDSCVLID